MNKFVNRSLQPIDFPLSKLKLSVLLYKYLLRYVEC